MSKPVRLFRPVTAHTSRELAVFRTVRQGLPDERIFPRAILGADIIEKNESQPVTNLPEPETFRPLSEVVYPLPNSSQNSLTLKVIGAAFLDKGGAGTRALALLLDDPEGVIETERLQYLARMRRPEPDEPFLPSVSLFDVATSSAKEDIREWVERRAPSSVSLGRISTYPHVPKPPRNIPIPPRKSDPSDVLPPIDRSDVITEPRRLGSPLPPDLFAKMHSKKPDLPQE
jgi:hypothetical protein